MILEINNLSKSFGSLKVADAINLRIEHGEAVGIIGPNGAGKSCLFNLITGTLAADEGRIRLNGVDITQSKPHQRCMAGIGRSYQIPRPFESLSVLENLLVGAVYGQRRRERDVVASCIAILETTNLLRHANRPAGSLTLLERKRLEVARALATAPQLLLLDEVAGGLSEGECQELVETIKDIHANGTTVVWIEHIVHALLAVVHRLIVLSFGRVIAEGDPRQVMASHEVAEIYMGIAA